MNPKTFFRSERRRAARDRLSDNLTIAQLTEATKRGRRGVRALYSTNGAGRGLDRVNEVLDKHGLTLHPTKGYRTTDTKRTLAESMTGFLKKGVKLGGSAGMKQALANA